MQNARIHFTFDVSPYGLLRIVNFETDFFSVVRTKSPIPRFKRSMDVVAFYGRGVGKLFESLAAD
jgi:hypothetical protein